MKTKIILAIAVATALALAAVGLAAAQISQNQTIPSGENAAVSDQGFWNWIGGCFGYRASQGQYAAHPADDSDLAPEPYNTGYGYGYGPCWAWR
jgi:hypothetical protein